MNLNQLTASNIRLYRERLNLTQKFMADNLDIAINSYSLIELGKTKITLDNLVKISELLNTNISTLIGKSADIVNNTSCIILGQNNNGTLYFQLSEQQLEKLNNKYINEVVKANK